MSIRTLLFTDVVESTRLVERVGDARAAELWSTHDRRSRALLAQHRGREIDRTDGFFLLFEEPLDAARYALGYHQTVADLGLKARVGIHVGSITLRKNSLEDIGRGAKPVEVEGLAKPFASRIMALAGGGQTLLSAAARDALADTIPDGAAIERHGHYRLKGIEEPIETLELGVRDSSPFSPPADTDKAYRVVRAHGDIWRPVREVRQNLPTERDAFIGRTAELRSLSARFDAGTRLLTVLGPGGTGKTRLVRRYSWIWLGDWPGGVYFCDLSEARSLDGIYFSVASALEVPLGKEDPAVQLGHAIAGRGRCLVVVDNFEQVVQYAPETLGRWLDQAPDAAFVVTSRERLHLAGEEIFPVEPLPLIKDAVDLFAARATAQKPDFVLGEGNRAAVAEVVRLLDGLPLAIELAAARVPVLSPAQIVERLRDRFGLLAGARGVAAHHATLRAAIDWSWELLAPWEQAALAQCSIFEGGFTLEAAEAVLDLCAWPQAPAAMDVVQALSDKSLLRTWIPVAHSRYDIEKTYFGMYLSIHEYAANKLAASGREAGRAAEERHGRYFARFGTDDALRALGRHGGVKLRRLLALELDNLVSACRRAVGRADGECAVATYQAVRAVLTLQGPGALGIDLGSEVLALDTLDASQRIAALDERALALHRAGRTKEAASGLKQALELARGSGDRRREARVIGNLGNLRRDQGLMTDARPLLETSIAMARETNSRGSEGSLIGNLGILHAVQGRLEEAQAHFEQAIVIHREVGNRRLEGADTSNLGLVYQEQGKSEEARAHFEQALTIHREVGNRRDEGLVVGNLGLLCSDLGQLDEARQLCEDALTICREVGDRQSEGAFLGGLADVLRDLGRTEEAMVPCGQALAVHRAAGNRRAEGVELGRLGHLLAMQRRFNESREALRTGEALLREIGDQLSLAVLLCKSGHTELAGNDIDAARAALAAAEKVIEAAGAGPGTEAARAVSKLRRALAL